MAGYLTRTIGPSLAALAQDDRYFAGGFGAGAGIGELGSLTISGSGLVTELLAPVGSTETVYLKCCMPFARGQESDTVIWFPAGLIDGAPKIDPPPSALNPVNVHAEFGAAVNTMLPDAFTVAESGLNDQAGVLFGVYVTCTLAPGIRAPFGG